MSHPKWSPLLARKPRHFLLVAALVVLLGPGGGHLEVEAGSCDSQVDQFDSAVGLVGAKSKDRTLIKCFNVWFFEIWRTLPVDKFPRECCKYFWIKWWVPAKYCRPRPSPTPPPPPPGPNETRDFVYYSARDAANDNDY